MASDISRENYEPEMGQYVSGDVYSVEDSGFPDTTELVVLDDPSHESVRVAERVRDEWMAYVSDLDELDEQRENGVLEFLQETRDMGEIRREVSR